MEKSLNNILYPKSIALVGASTKEGSVGMAIFKNLLFSKFKGVVYPVNPKVSSICGVKTYPSVLAIEDDISLAIIVVPRESVVEVLLDCAKKSIHSAIIITSGFKEIGGKGIELEAHIKEIAEQYNMSIIGPNCLGVINTDEDVRLNATFARGTLISGSVSFVSQSGAVGVAALEFATINKIGFSKFISIGNKTVINENNVLLALKDDPSTRVILGYFESLSDPKEFIRIAREITSGSNPKPILVLKAGRTESGKRATVSHTGSLSGRDKVFDFLFEQCGVMRVNTLEELFNYALFFANQPLPQGSKLAIITNGGGHAILATDEAEKQGIVVPEFSQTLQSKLQKILPVAASTKNPADLLGDADENRYESVIKEIILSDEVDTILVICLPQLITPQEKVAEKISKLVEWAKERKKVIVSSFVGFGSDANFLTILDKSNIPNYKFPEDAVRSIAMSLKYSRWLTRPRTTVVKFDVNVDVPTKIFEKISKEGRHFLTEPESYEILKAYELPIAEYKVTKSYEEAVRSAASIGYPVVAKVVSEDIIHKFDYGGVVVGIKNEEQLKNAYYEIFKKVRSRNESARISGILIQKMVENGVETIIGAKYDEYFGHILMFGLGGIYVEVFEDVTFRIIPITALSAKRMIEGIKGYKILSGFRGEAPKDIAVLAQCLEKLSQLVMDFPQIMEIDLNPVFALQEKVQIADARIIIK